MAKGRLSPLKKNQKSPKQTNLPMIGQLLTKTRSNFKTVFPQGCVQAVIPYRSGQGMLLSKANNSWFVLFSTLEFFLMKLHIDLEYKHTVVLFSWVFFSGRECKQLPTTSGGIKFRFQLSCWGISGKTFCLCHHSFQIYWIEAQSVWKETSTKLHPQFPWMKSCFRRHCADENSRFSCRQDLLTWIFTKTPW